MDVPTAPRFSAERLARLADIERRHFWFVGRRALVDKLLRKHTGDGARRVLDVGCGTGFMVDHLARRGYRPVGLDARPEGILAMRRAQPGALLLQSEASPLPFAPGSFDAALLLDVLEHVDDRAALREVSRALRTGGWIALSVPALPWLWSYRDQAAGHLRRYTRQSLALVLSQAGLEIAEMRYYQCLLLPLAIATRALGRRGPRLRDLEDWPRPIVNRIMTWINLLEVKLSDAIAWPWGSSLVAICRKGAHEAGLRPDAVFDSPRDYSAGSGGGG